MAICIYIYIYIYVHTLRVYKWQKLPIGNVSATKPTEMTTRRFLSGRWCIFSLFITITGYPNCCKWIIPYLSQQLHPRFSGMLWRLYIRVLHQNHRWLGSPILSWRINHQPQADLYNAWLGAFDDHLNKKTWWTFVLSSKLNCCHDRPPSFCWNEFEWCNLYEHDNIPKYNDYPSSWSSCAQNQRHLCCTLAHFNFTHPFSSTVDVTKHSFEPWNKKEPRFFRWPAWYAAGNRSWLVLQPLN